MHIRRFAPLGCAVTCLRRCGGYCLKFNTSGAGSRKYDPIYDAGQSVLASLEEKHTRNTRHRVSAGSRQDPFTSQYASLHPSCRRDTHDASVVMHDSTKNVAVPLPMKKQYVKEYSPSWSGHVPPDEKRVLQLAGRTMMSSQLSRTRNLVAPRDDFKTRLNSGSGSGWWIFCLWCPTTTRIQECA